MKFIAVTCVLMLGIVLSSCGGGNRSDNINGTWTAMLTDSGGTTAFAFTTAFTQGSGSNLTITNFSFTTEGSCFSSQPVTETGSFALSGNFSGNVSGTLAMTITSTNDPSDVLKLQGTVSNGKITGTWTLTGSTACTGNGTFVMTPM